MAPRTVAVVGAVGVTIGWLLASTLAPPSVRVQTLPERPSARSAGDAPPAAFTERLQWRLAEAPPPPGTRRNPFTFASRPRAVAAPEIDAAAPAARDAIAAPTAVAATPTLVLAGIGVADTARTAVLTDGLAVFVVSAGQVVAGYRVVEIADQAVTLTDAAGATFTLRLP